MERLSGMDATFLYVETQAGHMHVAMVGIYDVSTMPGGYSFEKFREHIRSRLHLVPPFRRRLVEVPFQFHHPVWIEDPDFDLDNHVRRTTAPAPGGRRELAQVASEIASVPLDRSRPLWEAWVIEGLKHDRIGFVCKIHHAAIDGASGAEIMTALYDLEPDPAPTEPVEVEAEHVPSNVELLSYAAMSKVRRATNAVPLVTRTLRSASNLVGTIIDKSKPHGAVPLTAPYTPFNLSIGAERATSFARIPLEETRAVKDALNVKVNDVILEVCAGTLRRYLQLHDALPEESLIAVCPVSVRVEEEMGSQGNKVSAMFASLATQIDDPAERLEAIRKSTEGAKEDHKALGARTLTDWAEWAAPRTFGLAARTYSSMGLADHHRPIHNLVISNVPGPPFPLYLAGAELVAAYPMGPIMDGAGLNITVLSYRNHVDIGFLADAALVPDIWEVAAQVRPAFEELKQLAGLTDPTIIKGAAPVTVTSAPPKPTTPKSGATKTPTPKSGAAKSATSKSPAARKTSPKPRKGSKAGGKTSAAKDSSGSGSRTAAKRRAPKNGNNGNSGSPATGKNAQAKNGNSGSPAAETSAMQHGAAAGKGSAAS